MTDHVIQEKSTIRLSVKRKVLYSAAMVVLALLFLEGAARVLYYQLRATGHHSAIIHALTVVTRPFRPFSVRIKFDTPLHRFDPVLGYRNIPGDHDIRFELRDRTASVRTYDFKAFIGEDGYRTTSENSADYVGKPEI